MSRRPPGTAQVPVSRSPATAARAPDFTEQDGYLTPSLKVRRTVVTKDFAADIEALYS